MRRLFVVVLASCVSWSVPRSGSAAVTDYIGKPVASVRLVVEDHDTTDPALTQLVETAVGQPLSMLLVRESIVHLFSLGQFEDVRVDATLIGGRVALRYDLVPIHPVTKIRFTGDTQQPGIDESALRRAIADRFGATPPVGKTADLARVVTDALGELGYRRARLTPQVEISHSPEHAVVTFAIASGPRTTIHDITIDGTPSVAPEEFLRRLGLVRGGAFRRDELNQRIDRYIAERRSKGYYDAKVNASVRFVDEEQRADVTVKVNHGPHVRVVFVGDSLPSDVRSDLVPVEREGSVDEDLLEDSTSRIEEYFRNLGYRDAQAPHARETTDGELVITFRITRGPQYRVAQLEVTGNTALPIAEFESSLKLREGEPYSENRLDADAALIEDLYRRRGYASAKVQPTAAVQRTANAAAQVAVTVRLDVIEGARTIIDAIRIDGNERISEAELRSKVPLQTGTPFIGSQVVAARDAMLLEYTDRGYENASVTIDANYASDNSRVSLTFFVREGPQVFVDHVLIVGNVRTSDAAIARELQLKQGDPLSITKVNDSQRRLLGLGLFRRVRINELRHGDETLRDLLVTVEESPPSTIGYGFGGEGRFIQVREDAGGVAVQRLQIAPRSFLEYSRRNLFGTPRSINLFASVSVPLNQTTVSGGLPEYRFLGTYREPRLFNTATDGLLNVTVEQQIRSSFTYRRYIGTAQAARRLSGGLFVTGAYQLQRTELVTVNVDDVGSQFQLINRLFSPEPLRLSAFSASVIRDTRNDQANPAHGQYFSVNGQIDAVAIGSEVGFAKSFFRAQTFHELRHANGTVFAANASLGVASEFNGDVPIPEPERFFAGGDTTNRGFALDTLGVRHVPPDPGSDTIDGATGFPIGGNATVILNGELRVPVGSGVSVVGFVDTGNVFQRASQLNVSELRTAVGFGIRYQSPFGPLRVDLGFKTRLAQITCSSTDAAGPCFESRPALHISFGQAF
ncbi:MAG TPA: POTRA domain-containing protein [Vicinamibacterales bacterium]|nr:POTRA domain-containing protein [Vicinamibacterales bacterium]